MSDFRSGASTPTLPKSGLRAPSHTQLSLPTTPVGSGPSSPLPKLRTTPGVNGAGKTLRKTISINAFPQPPRGGVRTTSLPPSPLSGGLVSKRESMEELGATPAQKLRKRPKTTISPNTSFASAGSVSLMNGTGDSRSISSGPGARGSDGLLSLPSPPQSRSSSAQDSYSTSATTTFDDGDGPRGREASAEAYDSKNNEIKGNVIVSVRVRPDANSGNGGKSEGEWMVDGRRSLVAYRGKEGGDHYFGMFNLGEIWPKQC